MHTCQEPGAICNLLDSLKIVDSRLIAVGGLSVPFLDPGWWYKGGLGSLWHRPITYHTIPYHTIPYHTIPYHTIPYHVMVIDPGKNKTRDRFVWATHAPCYLWQLSQVNCIFVTTLPNIFFCGYCAKYIFVQSVFSISKKSRTQMRSSVGTPNSFHLTASDASSVAKPSSKSFWGRSTVALVAVVALLLAEAVGVNFYYIAVAVVLTFTSSSNSRWLWVLTGPLSAQPPISFSNCHQMSLS